MTLRMRITGSGSFDRVDSTMLDHLDQWKTYPPKSSFNTSDPIGFSGMKTFEQPVIASKAGVQTLPALSFSYFDPSSRKYETARSAPLTVTISASQADSTAPPPPAVAGAGSRDAAGENKYAAALRPDHPAAGPVSSSLMPLFLQPKFLGVPSFLVIAFAAVWLGVRRQRADERPIANRRVASKAAKQVLAQLEAAARAGNAALFFDLARQSLQRAYAQRWQLSPEQITSAEIDARMGSDDDIRQLFAYADESKYSGRELQATRFARWLEIVREHLIGEGPP